jgi:hypothetical protein
MPLNGETPHAFLIPPVPSLQTVRNVGTTAVQTTQRTEDRRSHSRFQVRHPRCVSTKSNYKLYTYIVKHNYTLGGMLFTIRKAQLHVSATNVGHLQVVQ